MTSQRSTVEDVLGGVQEQYSTYLELRQVVNLAASQSDPEFAAPLPTPLGLTFTSV